MSHVLAHICIRSARTHDATSGIGLRASAIATHCKSTLSTEGLDSIQESYGVDKSKSARFLAVDTKYKSWQGLYGAAVGDVLVELSEKFMANYEYPKSKKG
ncbi:hypothetical protein NLG97_g4227 [Lecanicillium saksenae]|uniref:Uncharacterized protein n=1 Tax=Lecanicillium saksenae TaxID=468837 RepID=A0ACC1QVW6_9HYPO|nr:hypothetical protein NLG97_g4227 [Lecanicillium saksenae]